MITRRKFLKIFGLGAFFLALSRKVKAERKKEEKLKEAMFWRRLD